MSGRDFAVCKQCGGTMSRVSPENTSPHIVECRKCGHREWAEIQVPPPWPAKDEEYSRVVVHRAEGRATALEIQALRKLNRDLGSLPVNEAAKRIGASHIIDLGVHHVEDARHLLKKARALDLKAVLKSPEESSIEEK